MDARDRLRQYLEQRKELGERELVLDDLSVEELMRMLGVPRGGRAPREREAAGAGNPAATGADRATAAESPRFAFPGRAATPAEPGEAPPSAPASAPGPVGARPGDVAGTPISVGVSVGDAVAASFAAGIDSLEAVAAAVAACRRCGLHSTATRPVPGEGNPDAKFVCVGEAPGQKEDETGRPFVGQAGQLLTKILDAIHFRREDVFICNVLKHRPPGNRNPAPDEIAACSPFLLQQLALLKPRVILALGTFAAQTLLQTALPIGKLRGQIHRYHGVPLVVTYHPAALLRNPNWKRPTWEDVKLARRIFDNAPDGA